MKGNKEFKQECDQAIGSIANMPKAAKTDQTAKSTWRENLKGGHFSKWPGAEAQPVRPQTAPKAGMRQAVGRPARAKTGFGRLAPPHAKTRRTFHKLNADQAFSRKNAKPAAPIMLKFGRAAVTPRSLAPSFRPARQWQNGACRQIADRGAGPCSSRRLQHSTPSRCAACALARLGFARARAVALFSPRPARPTHRLAHESSFRIAAWRGDCGAAVDGLGRDP